MSKKNKTEEELIKESGKYLKNYAKESHNIAEETSINNLEIEELFILSPFSPLIKIIIENTTGLDEMTHNEFKNYITMHVDEEVLRKVLMMTIPIVETLRDMGEPFGNSNTDIFNE